MNKKYSTEIDDVQKNYLDYKQSIYNQQHIVFHTDTSYLDKFTTWAIDYKTYFIILNLLDKIKPQKILEFGYGYSTMLFQQYAKFYKKSHTVIEDDENWIEFFNTHNNFLNTAKIILKQTYKRSINNFDNILAYENLNDDLDNNYDFILIDGPKGSNGISRPNILDIFDKLAQEFIIIVHDTCRVGEKNLVANILDKLQSCVLYRNDPCTIITNIPYITLEYFNQFIKQKNDLQQQLQKQ